MDDSIAHFPEGVELLPYIGDNRCCPEASGTGFAEAVGATKELFLVFGPENAQAAIEELSPSYFVLLEDKGMESGRVCREGDRSGGEPCLEAIDEDVDQDGACLLEFTAFAEVGKKGGSPALMGGVGASNNVVAGFFWF